MWDLPGPGLKPMSPALAGGFLTTVPPGKSLSILHLAVYICPCHHLIFTKVDKQFNGERIDISTNSVGTIWICMQNMSLSFILTPYIKINSKWITETSLVAQWLRIHLPMQGTWVRSQVQEDPTCHGATKLVHHNYWACTLEPAGHNYWARVPQLLKPVHLEPVLHNKRSHLNEKPMHCNEE